MAGSLSQQVRAAVMVGSWWLAQAGRGWAAPGAAEQAKPVLLRQVLLSARHPDSSVKTVINK